MILGYLLLAIIMGSLSSLVALLLGSSFWLAFGLYALVGTLTLIALPLIAMLMGVFSDQEKLPRDLRVGRNGIDLAEGSVDHV